MNSGGAILIPNRGHPLNIGRMYWGFILPRTFGGGRLVDIIGQNHGQFISGVTWNGLKRSGGNGSLAFDGTSGYVELPNTGGFADNLVAFTASAWFKIAAAQTGARILFSKLDSGGLPTGAGWVMYHNANKLSWFVETSGGAIYIERDSAANAWNDNKWHKMYLVKYSNATAGTALYVDGKIDPTNTLQSAGTLVTFTSTANIRIGNDNSGDYWPNNADDFSIWNRGLTPVEIAADYQLSITGYPGVLIRKSPVSWFPPQVATDIQFDAVSNSGYKTANADYNFAHTTGSGTNRFIRAEVEVLGTPGSTATVTYDFDGTPVVMTLIGSAPSATGAAIVLFYGLVAPASGTKNIRVQLSGAVVSATTVVSYANVHQTSPYANFNSAQATNVGAADATVTITTVATGSWAVSAVATDDTAITAGNTPRNNVTGAAGSGANEDTGALVAPGTTAMFYTDVAALATWAIGGYELRPDTASGLGVVGPYYYREFVAGNGGM